MDLNLTCKLLAYSKVAVDHVLATNPSSPSTTCASPELFGIRHSPAAVCTEVHNLSRPAALLQNPAGLTSRSTFAAASWQRRFLSSPLERVVADTSHGRAQSCRKPIGPGVRPEQPSDDTTT
eukprot:1299141-Amphidinium_carterae.1